MTNFQSSGNCHKLLVYRWKVAEYTMAFSVPLQFIIFCIDALSVKYIIMYMPLCSWCLVVIYNTMQCSWCFPKSVYIHSIWHLGLQNPLHTLMHMTPWTLCTQKCIWRLQTNIHRLSTHGYTNNKVTCQRFLTYTSHSSTSAPWCGRRPASPCPVPSHWGKGGWT